MQLWTTSTKGLGILGIETGRGKRARHTQAQFWKKLIQACNSKSPTPRSHDLWCSILGHFFPIESMHAEHIFPWAEGQVAMDEIFGREVENMEEPNEIPSGLMLSTYAEKRLEDGDIVLVPDVTDAASQEEIDAWCKSEPKEYKIRVANPEAKGMNWLQPGDVSPRRSWNELDGRKVQFSSDHRPSSAVSLRAVLQNNAKTLMEEESHQGQGCTTAGTGEEVLGPKRPLHQETSAARICGAARA